MDDIRKKVKVGDTTGEEQERQIQQQIDRSLLDFDFEKMCSVSLSRLHVYCCLKCGKYFQGRGRQTHAYLHSLEQQHSLFLNLATRETYSLPSNTLVESE